MGVAKIKQWAKGLMNWLFCYRSYFSPVRAGDYHKDVVSAVFHVLHHPFTIVLGDNSYLDQ